MPREMSREPPDEVAAAFAGTYDTPRYADPWEAVVDHRRVQKYHATHPDASRTAVGNALELPSGPLFRRTKPF
jgi:hypothetical protein